jgi:hypothetical protein
MPRLTSRDYKGSRRGSLDLRRHQQFLYGAVAGVLLASVAFMYLGAPQHPAALGRGAPAPHPAVLAAADGSAASALASAEAFTYPDMLAKTPLVIPAREKHVKRTPPPGHRAQDAVR